MSVDIKWGIISMDSYPTYENYQNVVTTVHWECLGKQTSGGKIYTGRVYGCISLKFEVGMTFVPYDELTEMIVLEWVWYTMGNEEKLLFEQMVKNQIDELISPNIVNLPLSWIEN